MALETVDIFHRGRFVLVQPKGAGHRSGVDAMILAASVPSGFSGLLADLGAGAGAAVVGVVVASVPASGVAGAASVAAGSFLHAAKARNDINTPLNINFLISIVTIFMLSK